VCLKSWTSSACVCVCVSAGQGAAGWGRLQRRPPLRLRGSFRLARCGKHPRTLRLQRLPDGFEDPDGPVQRLAEHQRRGTLQIAHRHVSEGRILTRDQPASVLYERDAVTEIWPFECQDGFGGDWSWHLLPIFEILKLSCRNQNFLVSHKSLRNLNISNKVNYWRRFRQQGDWL